jgi:hypothetical protein
MIAAVIHIAKNALTICFTPSPIFLTAAQKAAVSAFQASLDSKKNIIETRKCGSRAVALYEE